MLGTSTTSATRGLARERTGRPQRLARTTGALAATWARPAVAREAVLVVVTIAWGATFLITQLGLRYADPFEFVAMRFGVAALVMAVAAGRRIRGCTRREFGAGVLLGGSLFGGYALQTIGLQMIPSSTSAFLTAFYVPLVPILAWAGTRRPLSRSNIFGIALAFAGVVLLSGVPRSSLNLGVGELTTLIGAVAIATEILLTGHFAPKVDVQRLSFLALATCAVLAAVCIPLGDAHLPTPSWGLAATAGGLGLATAGIQCAITWAQQSVPPARATIIYAGEPMWGGIFGAIAGDTFTPSTLAGAALILASLALPALLTRPRPRRRPRRIPGDLLTIPLALLEDIRQQRRESAAQT